MNYERARARMIEEQLVARGISDARVLAAMARIERHRFVDEALADRAYDDKPLPIGARQTISQPFMVGLMTETLVLHGAERVLEIGTGCGYQTAVLAELVAPPGSCWTRSATTTSRSASATAPSAGARRPRSTPFS